MSPTPEKLKYEAQRFNNHNISQFFSGNTATQLGLLDGSPLTGSASRLSLFQLFSPYLFSTNPTNVTFEGMTYNGMNLRVQKSTSHGLDLIVAYTVSKQMDNWSAGGAAVEAVDPIHYSRTGIIGGRHRAVESAYGGSWTFQDPSNRNADRAIAVDEIPQQFNVGANHELLVGRGKALLNRGDIGGNIFGAGD